MGRVSHWSGIVAAWGLLVAGGGHAGTVTDGRLGPVQSLSGQMTIPQSLGTAVGPNLFHSFATFSIDAGESATFTSVDPFKNVISRVTGGVPSSINGPLISTILDSVGSGAAFWFINPAGIVFGSGASLSLPQRGSFHASTADYLSLGNCDTTPESCGRFNASLPDGSTLVVAPPASFGFLGTSAGAIQVNGAFLQAPLYATLSLVGGAVSASDANMTANSGRINIESAAGPGEVDAANTAGTTVTKFGNLSLVNTTVVTDGIAGVTPGGRIFIRGGAVVADASAITSNHFGVSTGAGISITGTDSIALSSRTTVGVVDAGIASAGAISLSGGDVSISGGSSVVSRASGSAVGPAIDIAAAGIRITGGGTVISTGTAGDAGDIKTTATGSVIIDGAGVGQTGILSAVLPGTNRNAGSVSVQAGGTLSLLANGLIGSQTAGAGSAGQLMVSATTIDIDGTGAPGAFTGITSQAAAGATGISSAVAVNADSISIRGGGEITSDTFAVGSAGRVTVNGGNILIDGTTAAPGRFTGISAGSQSGATGNAGAVEVEGDSITILGRGGIATDTSGSGAAGDVTLNGDTILIEGSVTSASRGAGSGAGRAGNITVAAGAVTLDPGGQVAATTIDGAGGAVTLNADTVAIQEGAQVSVATSGSGNAGDVLLSGLGSAPGNPTRSASVTASGAGSGIISNTSGTGNGGAITIVTSLLDVSDGAAISAASAAAPGISTAAFQPAAIDRRDVQAADPLRLGAAGSIFVDTVDLNLRSAGVIGTTSTTSGGGNIVIRSSGTTQLDRGVITASAQGLQAGDSGGNVTISRPEFLILNVGEIRADANAGRGGNISIDAVAFIASADSVISASSAQNVDGQVQNTAENQVSTVVQVDTPDLSPPPPLGSRCTPRQVTNRSSLIVETSRPRDVRSPYLPVELGADRMAASGTPCAPGDAAY